MIKEISFFLLFSGIISCFDYHFDPKNISCQMNMHSCSYTIVVHECISMRHKKYIVYAKDRELYGFNNFEHVKLNKSEVVSVDGRYNQKMICINSSFPGPILFAYEDQTVNIKVVNELENEVFTLHFHGQIQKGSNEMDGVFMINQLPIVPGSFFVYTFKAKPKGTYWYHAHGHLFFSLNGAFIVLPKSISKSIDKVNQHVLLITDYSSSMNALKDIGIVNSALIINNPPNENTTNQNEQLMLKALVSSRYSITLDNNCFNGKCESIDGHKVPLEIVMVKYNSLNRLRIVNSAGRNFYLITIDQHRFSVLSVDGIDVDQINNVESVILSPGERIDILLRANKQVGNYWIRGITLQHGCDTVKNKNPKALAILRYESAIITDPTSSPNDCLDLSCWTVGCFAKNQLVGRQCLTWTDLDSSVSSLVKESELPSPEEVIFINFDIINLPLSPRFAINYKTFLNHHSMIQDFRQIDSLYLPNLNILHKKRLKLNSCDQCFTISENITHFCECYHTINLRPTSKNKYAYMLFADLNRDLTIFRPGLHEHPAHIHGHSFQVLKVFMPEKTTSDKDCSNFEKVDHISCENDRKDGFAKFGCLNGKINVSLKSLNLKMTNPIEKDTITIPTGGYALVRFPIDNPGLWSLHCHNFYHHLGGMMAVINESK